MERHIMLPIPNMSKAARQLATKEERLKLILHYLETSRQSVHANIIRSAETTICASKRPNHGHDDLRSYYANAANDLEELPDATAQEVPIEHIDEELLASLSAPYIEGSGDPCITNFNSPPPDSVNIRNGTAPQERRPEVTAVLEALDLIQEYDNGFRKTRDIYVKALEREKASKRVNVRRGGDGSANGTQCLRRESAPLVQAVRPPTGPKNDRRTSIGPIGLYDASRDPRLRS